MLETEFEFTLPCGLVDAAGTLHRHGVMRRATARDEVLAMQDARARGNEAWLAVLLLGRVVTRLGTLDEVTPDVVESLFSADFVYLQELFVRINDLGPRLFETACPACGHRFALDFAATLTPEGAGA